ncbi:MAG: hypothetical protein A3F68_02955, partial [Acidobacteria bacterium RIFCSPLOWO2_12_FULL_54_10]
MKFGGTSVGDAKCIDNVKDIVAKAAKEHSSVVVVVSAMSTVTETILEATRLAASGDEPGAMKKIAQLEQKHFQAADELFNGVTKEEARKVISGIVDELKKLCGGMALLREMPLRAVDAALSVGERLSSILVARHLMEQGIKAEAVDSAKCVLTDDHFGSARPLMDKTRDATRSELLPMTEHKCVPVVTGFLGATAQGARTTLGRGGSDYSGAIVAAALDADELWIWTDVDGVLSADPKTVGEAVFLDELTYEEASELSHFGAKVLHHKTLAPLLGRMIPVYIKNSFAPEKRGTRIGAPREGSPKGPKAVTSIAPVTLLTLRSNGTPGTTELFARTFAALSHSQIEILMVTQASYQESFCLLVPQAAADRAKAAIEHAFRLEINHGYLQPPERQDVAAIALIGEGMRG